MIGREDREDALLKSALQADERVRVVSEHLTECLMLLEEAPNPEDKELVEGDVPLPPVTVPVFAGDYADWPAFEDLYSSVVHTRTDITPAYKMAQLMSRLHGEPHELLTHLAVSDSNYEVAWKILTDRYRNKRLIVDRLLDQWLSIPTITRGTDLREKIFHPGVPTAGRQATGWQRVRSLLRSGFRGDGVWHSRGVGVFGAWGRIRCECPSSTNCRYCQGAHHPLLCMNRSGGAGAALDRISEGACPPRKEQRSHPPRRSPPPHRSQGQAGDVNRRSPLTQGRGDDPHHGSRCRIGKSGTGTWPGHPSQVRDSTGGCQGSTRQPPGYMQYSAGLSHLVGSQDPRMPRLCLSTRGYRRNLGTDVCRRGTIELQPWPSWADLPSSRSGTHTQVWVVRIPAGRGLTAFRFPLVWRPQDLPEGDPVLYGSVLSEVLQRFWESEEPPTADRRKPEDDECELFYQYNTARCPSGRFVTRLPFLPNRPALGWIKRFVNNCRKPQAERNFTPVLSPAERNAALCSLVRVVQAEHFEEEKNLTWVNENNTVTYYSEKTWHFVPEMSNGSLSDMVTTINPVIATVAYFMRYQRNILKIPVDVFLRTVHDNLFITANVSTWMFEGFDDPVLDIANRIPNFPIPIPFDRFGWFYGRNATMTYDGIFNINTGAEEFSRLGKVETWNYSNRTVYRDECGIIKGSTGELWAPELDQAEVNVFASDLCTGSTGELWAPELDQAEVNVFASDLCTVGPSIVNRDECGSIRGSTGEPWAPELDQAEVNVFASDLCTSVHVSWTIYSVGPSIVYRDECETIRGSTGELWAPELDQAEVNVFASDLCTSVHVSWTIYSVGLSIVYRDECGTIKGSTGELWAPELDQAEVNVFASDLCTFVTLARNDTVVIRDIEGVMFKANESIFDNGYRYPERACYCDEIRDENCMPYGTLNISICRYGAPAFVSLPHFLYSDPYYPSKIEGLEPKE
ncbi:CD36 family domain-containing protein [Phthorimaea operculella]|nr:CD36 family domain-containing protein [Phthorimaea operculella]